MIDRRTLLRAAGLGTAAGLLGACSGDDGAASGSVVHPFRGAHQAGVLAPLTEHGVVAALDVRAESVEELAEALRALSEAVEHVMSGEPYERRGGGFPPLDTGMLGRHPGATGTSVVVGFGHSLFDHRFGLTDRRPAELVPMPSFANDYLVRDERSHGDIVLVITADTNDATVHALRQVLRSTRGLLTPRWQWEGHNSLIPPDVRQGGAPMRNLMGFKDGTANPHTDDVAAMNRVVWIQHDDGEPAWAVGGTYLAVRIIRMMVEFWDRTRLNEQETIFGRHRDSGAPLGMSSETDEPVFDGPSHDLAASHIARANPRTPGSERNLILRKGFNYTRGLDENDQLDQGLVFMAFQRSLEDGFVTVQRRLDGEALEEYVRPLGGGFYVVPPPPAAGEFLGERLLTPPGAT